MSSKQGESQQAGEGICLKEGTNLHDVRGKTLIQFEIKIEMALRTQLYPNYRLFFSQTHYCFHCCISLMWPQATLDPNFHQRIHEDVKVMSVEKCNKTLCCFALGRNEQEAF